MAKTDYETADEYIATLSSADQNVIRQMQAAVLKAVPDAEEVISYQIPAYKYHGWIFYLSVASKHYAISTPPPSALFTMFEKQLKPFSVSKSTIQFPKNQPVPLDLISEMARFRADENLEREAKK